MPGARLPKSSRQANGNPVRRLVTRAIEADTVDKGLYALQANGVIFFPLYNANADKASEDPRGKASHSYVRKDEQPAVVRNFVLLIAQLLDCSVSSCNGPCALRQRDGACY